MPLWPSADGFMMFWMLAALLCGDCCNEGLVGESAKLLLSERLESVEVSGEPVAPDCSCESLVNFFFNPIKEGISRTSGGRRAAREAPKLDSARELS